MCGEPCAGDLVRGTLCGGRLKCRTCAEKTLCGVPCAGYLVRSTLCGGTLCGGTLCGGSRSEAFKTDYHHKCERPYRALMGPL